MRVNEVTYTDAVPVDGYGVGFFRLGGEVQDGAVLIMGSGAVSWGGFDDSAGLVAAAGELDVVLVGTGADIAHIPAVFREAVEAAGIGVEIMATPQACRTYNVLLGEGRRVALAALPV
ncbi:MAG: hypothetical protein GKR98_03960 [Boseongicola sp.]|nr:MAG: hypothetical protein GKR98_03960 [Boseongicola sp.]